MFQGSKCVEEQNVLRSDIGVCKVCQVAKCSMEQSVCQPFQVQGYKNFGLEISIPKGISDLYLDGRAEIREKCSLISWEN